MEIWATAIPLTLDDVQFRLSKISKENSYEKNILEIIIIIILIAILTVLMLLFLKVNKTTDKDIIEDNTATMWDNEDNSVNVSDDNKEVIEYINFR